MFNSIRLVQIILNLIASQDPKFTTVRFGDNPHLNVLRRHLALEPFAEGEESRVNRVLQFHVVRVPLLEEVLGVDVVLDIGVLLGGDGAMVTKGRDETDVRTNGEQIYQV